MMIEPIADLLLASRRMTGAQPNNARRALRAHEAILERVKAKDVEGARREMREHMMTTEHDIRATIGDEAEVGNPLEMHRCRCRRFMALRECDVEGVRR